MIFSENRFPLFGIMPEFPERPLTLSQKTAFFPAAPIEALAALRLDCRLASVRSRWGETT
jgi:hypothetical protein